MPARVPRWFYRIAVAAFLLIPSVALAQPFPGAARYVPTTGAALVPPPTLAGTYDAARTAGARAGRTLIADGPLAAAAQVLAEQIARDGQHRQLSYVASRALINAAGMADHDVVYDFWWIPAGAPVPSVGTDLLRVMDSARNFAYDRVGVGSATGPEGTLLLVALGWRNASFTSEIPRFLAVGAALHAGARLGNLFRTAWLTVTRPDGTTDTLRLGDGPEVSFDVPLPSAGVYQLELSATGSVGPRPLLNFFVFAGDARPALPDSPYAATVLAESPTEMESGLFERINTARRSAGLPPLRINPTLTQAARGHSADMAANHFEGHVSPTTGSANDRVLRAGLHSGVVLENVDGGYGSEEIHGAFMNSPGHRAAILDGRVTDVGIGAAVQHNPEGDIMMVTEDFAEVLASIDVTAAPALALSRINTARSAHGTPALAAQPALSNYADGLARSYFTGSESTQQLQDRARNGLSATGVPFRNSMVQVLSVSRIDDVAQQAWLLQPDFTALGVGVAQGTRPGGTGNEIIVVLVLVQDSVAAVDPTSASASMLAAINRARQDHGAGALREDPRVSAYALEAARRFFSGNESPQQAQDRTRSGFNGLGVPYRTVMVQLIPVSNVESAARQEWLLRGDLNAVGLGVAQGTRGDTLRNQLVVVLILFTAR